MKYAVSNIALPAYQHTSELGRLQALGLQGLEIAPSRIWEDTWSGLTAGQISAYRRQIETAGLEVVGLHSLLFDQPELELFGSAAGHDDLLAFFVHLSEVCRDLGGKSLIWGGGRRRGEVTNADAESRTIDFFDSLADRIDSHGTCYCIEPLGPTDTDFIHSVFDSKRIVDAVDRPSLKIQIDAKALAANNELTLEPFVEAGVDLVHYHANEPGFEILGASGAVDHAAAGAYLRTVGYAGYVSIEQKQIDPDDPLTPISKSIEVLRKAYL